MKGSRMTLDRKLDMAIDRLRKAVSSSGCECATETVDGIAVTCYAGDPPWREMLDGDWDGPRYETENERKRRERREYMKGYKARRGK